MISSSKTAMLDTILKLRAEGYSMIPSGGGDSGKSPAISWKAYQKKLPSTARISDWFVRSSKLWGMVTGNISGVVLVDNDGADLSIFEKLEPHIRTPRGGGHYYFQYPGYYVKTVAGILPKIDIRADGGFVNVIGENKKGKYVIEKLPTKDNIYPWEMLPRQILEATNGGKTANSEPAPEPQGTPIPEGQRNSTLLSLAGSMRHRGMMEGEIESALMAVNQGRCQPPLDDDEVQKIAKSISRYQVGKNTPLTDTGNAELLAELNGDDLRYDHIGRRWLCWNGNFWRPDKDGLLYRLAIEAARLRFARAVSIDDTDLKNKIARWATNSESRQKVEACISLARTIPPFADDGRNWDKDTMLLGTENGVIDLHTGNLRPGRREDRITMSVGFDYDPDAKCPRWEQFLREIFDDEELMALSRGLCEIPFDQITE